MTPYVLQDVCGIIVDHSEWIPDGCRARARPLMTWEALESFGEPPGATGRQIAKSLENQVWAGVVGSGGSWWLHGLPDGRGRSSKSSEGAYTPGNHPVSTQNGPQRCHKLPGTLRES